MSDHFVFFTLMMAICLLGLLPTVVLVLLLRKYIVRGLVARAQGVSGGAEAAEDATLIRFGLIGYGAWGRHHAEAIVKAPGARLAAIACRTEATAEAARRAFPDVPVYLDYRDLLAKSDVDAVDVVLPNYLRAEVGVAALEHGKDVLLEKSMARTGEECDVLIAAARRSGRVLSIGHELRLSAQWGRIKQMIDAGEIGEPLSMLFELFRFSYRRGADGWRYERDRVGSWIL